MNITPFVQKCIKEGASVDTNHIRHVIFNDYEYQPSLFGDQKLLGFKEPSWLMRRAVTELSFNPVCIQFQAKGITGLRGDRIEVYSYAWDEIDSINHGNSMVDGGWIETNRFKLDGMGAKLLDMITAVIILNATLASLYSFDRLPYIQKGVSAGYINQYRLRPLFDENGFVSLDGINAFMDYIRGDHNNFRHGIESCYQISMAMATWIRGHVDVTSIGTILNRKMVVKCNCFVGLPRKALQTR
jgi:hypothetical protein